MKYLKCSLVAVAMLALVATAQVSSATSVDCNALADAGFESPIVDDGSGVGKWNPFADGAAGNTSEQGTMMPRTGAGHLDLAIADGNANGFAGVFQDVPFIGDREFEFRGWHKDNAGTNGAGIEIRLEYQDANGEIGRTGNFTPVSLGSDYEEFSVVDTTPTGTTTVRVVYAIQSFGGITPQSIFVDDTWATCVPEPASLGLLSMAGLAVATMRRRK